MGFSKFIEKHEQFFENYRTKFREILKKELQKLDDNAADVNLLLKNANILYEAFLNIESPIIVNRFKKILQEVFKSGIPVRRTLENTLIQLLKDYIEYQQARNALDFEQIKLLVALIEKYLDIVHKVFVNYMESLEKATKKEEEEELVKPNEEVLQLVRRLNPVSVNLIAFFEGFPIICRTTVEKITSFIEVSFCNYKVFAPNTKVYIQIPRFNKCILGVIINIHNRNFIITPIKFTDCPKTAPVKVFPEKEIDVKICKGESCVYGFLKTISLEEVEVWSKMVEDLQTGDTVEISFTLETTPIRLKAVINGIERLKDYYKIVAKIISDRKIDRILSGYIIKRQQEILRDLRI